MSVHFVLDKDGLGRNNQKIFPSWMFRVYFMAYAEHQCMISNLMVKVDRHIPMTLVTAVLVEVVPSDPLQQPQSVYKDRGRLILFDL